MNRTEFKKQFGFDLDREANKLWKIFMKNGGEPRCNYRLPEIETGGTSRGYANYNRHQVYLGCGTNSKTEQDVWYTLLHELAHIAHPPDRPCREKNERRNPHSREFYYSMRAVIEKRCGILISFASVKTWGYSVDAIIERQLFGVHDWKLTQLKATQLVGGTK